MVVQLIKVMNTVYRSGVMNSIVGKIAQPGRVCFFFFFKCYTSVQFASAHNALHPSVPLTVVHCGAVNC